VTTSAGLKRVVTRWEIVGISLNSVVGSGVYLLPAAAAALLGSASLWAVPLAGLAVLLLALCFAEAGSHYDEPGASYIYAREAFGELVGFQVGWMTWLARVAAGASLLNGFVQAVAFLWSGAASGTARFGIITAMLAFIVWVNIVGVKHGARLSVGLTIAKVVPLLLLIVLSIPSLDWSLIFPMPAPPTAGLGQAALLLLYAYAGFESTGGTAAGEFENPKRDVPFAVITVIALSTLLYMLIQLVALGTLPDLADRAGGAPLAESAALVIGVWAASIMTLGAAISIGGTVSSTILLGPRYLYALAKDGYGPQILAAVHERYRTPAWAIATQGLIVWVLALSGSFVQLAMLSVIARLATYVGTAAAVPLLRRKFAPTEHTIVLPGGAAIPILALLLCIAFAASAALENLLAGLVGLAVGAAVYFLRESPQRV